MLSGQGQLTRMRSPLILSLGLRRNVQLRLWSSGGPRVPLNTQCNAVEDRQGILNDISKDIGQEAEREAGNPCKSARSSFLYIKHSKSRKQKLSQLRRQSLLKQVMSVDFKNSARFANKGLRFGAHANQSSVIFHRQVGSKRLFVAPSRIHGQGVFSERAIAKNEHILDFCGEIIRNSVADVREKKYKEKGILGCYMFALSEELVIDGTVNGGFGRFINHSCEPNVVARVVEANENKRISFFCMKYIEPGSELLYDYRLTENGDAERIECLCRAISCSGFLG